MIKNHLTDTIPYICHFPGKSYRKHYGKEIFRHMHQNIIKDIILPDDLAVISFKTCDEESILESQLKNHSSFFLYQIKKIKWKHIYKIELMIDKLKNISHKYILHLDSYDVMFNQQDLSQIKHYLINDRIIFNSEKNFFNTSKNQSMIQNIKLAFDIRYHSSIYRYLNTGCFIGNKKDILNLYQKLLGLINKNQCTEFNSLSCDQAAMQIYWYLYDNNNKDSLIEIDDRCNLFMCMNYLNKADVSIL